MTWRPGKTFRVGAMRYSIDVQEHTDARDAAGQAVSTWANRLTSEPARFFDVGGGTAYRGQQLEETVIAVFEVRFRTGYDATQRIVFDGETYGITRVSRVDGGRRYLALFCKAVAA
jgi:SPP1 family predicted phage head-tail adaptor